MNNLVSIIIPTYNRVHLINETLDSVLAQSYSNYECIVVDDGSTDNTVDVLKKYSDSDSRIKVYQRPEASIKGAPTCRNIGLKNAKGEYVIFLDSDDYLMPYCLEKRVESFTANKDCDFLVFPMGVKRNNNLRKKEIENKESYLLEFLNYRLSWSIMCPFWKLTVLNELGGFTEGYPRLNDPELMIRALTNPTIKFKVFNELDFDTVYVPSVANWVAMSDKYYDSLFMFIPDICRALTDNKQSDLKYHLFSYLKVWFRDFYFPKGNNQVKRNLKLINLFKAHGVISSFKSLRIKFALAFYVFFNSFKAFFSKRLLKIFS